jgi:hypothetical protein
VGSAQCLPGASSKGNELAQEKSLVCLSVLCLGADIVLGTGAASGLMWAGSGGNYHTTQAVY